MDAKLAQGQFPATFPETFKNFFAMMNEDEDHVELFANLLEDKVSKSLILPQRSLANIHIASICVACATCRLCRQRLT